MKTKNGQRTIRLFYPVVGDEELSELKRVFELGWIGLGEETAKFENEFSQYIGARHTIGVNSCTSALDLALRLIGVGRGDQVIVPTMTFVSTAHAVAYNNATPVFADIDAETMTISPEEITRNITPRTKAIVVVHYSGRPVDFDAIREVSNDIPIIEDVAHACGGTYQGTPCGALGRIGCFSFHAVKNLAMGDGGAITLDDDAMAERAKRMRWLGIDKGTWDRTGYDQKYWWEYQVDEIGLKCHMNDIQAAMGRVQLGKLEQGNDRRREIAALYRKRLETLEWLSLPPDDDERFRSSWHFFYIRTEKDRNRLSMYLGGNGINTGVHYKPIHLYRCYGNTPVLPVAEQAFQKLLTLPMHLRLTNEDVEYICDKISQFD